MQSHAMYHGNISPCDFLLVQYITKVKAMHHHARPARSTEGVKAAHLHASHRTRIKRERLIESSRVGERFLVMQPRGNEPWGQHMHQHLRALSSAQSASWPTKQPPCSSARWQLLRHALLLYSQVEPATHLQCCDARSVPFVEVFIEVCTMPFIYVF